MTNFIASKNNFYLYAPQEGALNTSVGYIYHEVGVKPTTHL